MNTLEKAFVLVVFSFFSIHAVSQTINNAVTKMDRSDPTLCQVDADKVRAAVKLHQESYPKLQLNDLYKAFFQAEFGAEHIVADTTAAAKYLNRELTIPDHGKMLYEPIGADSTFFRVHLNAVQKGFITRDQLFHAFLAGVHKVEIPQINKWVQTWQVIEQIILSMDLQLPNLEEDKKAIHALLESGEYASHHSPLFEETYEPHYRIIRKDAFYKELYPYLQLKK